MLFYGIFVREAYIVGTINGCEYIEEFSWGQDSGIDDNQINSCKFQLSSYLFD